MNNSGSAGEEVAPSELGSAQCRGGAALVAALRARCLGTLRRIAKRMEDRLGKFVLGEEDLDR
jgi:hypothetical protein